ncbi:FadR/GntR family transcriptional regulator [uncultured Shimia sp.]|uniref:FadR/GntR family transcriptional regulator n=1 Tax=uncultured Shimia sp. TaxID=573152 RepID=UPI0025EA5ABF|nr:FadR/GntR family transcriptional regulator [uncultured Shimia sp.]
MQPEKDIQSDSPKRVADLIAETIIAQIKDGSLAVGDAVPTERELCNQFSTSRPTVREALSNLHLRGFVSTGTGKRPRVTTPSLEDVFTLAGDHIREILGNAESAAHLEQMRQFIEAGAVRVAAENASNIQVAKMQAALEDNRQAVGTKDFPESDIAFHRSIVAVVGNPIILKLHDMFVSKMLAHRPNSLSLRQQDPSSLRQQDASVYEEHRAIYEAVLCGDVVSATKQMDSHLERSYRSRLAAPKSLVDETKPVGDT